MLSQNVPLLKHFLNLNKTKEIVLLLNRVVEQKWSNLIKLQKLAEVIKNATITGCKLLQCTCVL